jgi:hypothetical protein
MARYRHAIMKFLVCGGRDFDDAEFLFRTLDDLHREHRFTDMVQGAAALTPWPSTGP